MTPGSSAGPRSGGLRSALYEGTVVHARTQAPRRRFSYPVALPLLFLDELAGLEGLRPLARLDGGGGWAPVQLRRSDFLAPAQLPLDEAVRLAAEAAGRRVEGPVAVLGHLRTWGWLFNPLTVYLCFDPAGDGVAAAVLEVSNTPWHERHVYVVGPPGEHTVDKALHVSPFLGMDARYRIRYSEPGERLDVRIDVVGAAQGEPRLYAAMSLRRRPLDRAGIARMLVRHPAMTTRVSAGIYAQAARLLAAGARFHPHPRRAA